MKSSSSGPLSPTATSVSDPLSWIYLQRTLKRQAKFPILGAITPRGGEMHLRWTYQVDHDRENYLKPTFLREDKFCISHKSLLNLFVLFRTSLSNLLCSSKGNLLKARSSLYPVIKDLRKSRHTSDISALCFRLSSRFPILLAFLLFTSGSIDASGLPGSVEPATVKHAAIARATAIFLSKIFYLSTAIV